jgi:predicted SAM-dependent methyltransferase
MDDGAAQRQQAAPRGHALEVRRLNWGCGEHPEPGWINSDVKQGAGIDLSGDILDGLALADDSVDYAVSIHALPEISYPDLVPALSELHRVLKPGGVLRLSLPDLDKNIHAYLSGDEDYFLVPDEEVETLGGKLVVQMVWYGYARSIFTHDFTAELLGKAGFTEIARCDYRQTASAFPEIVELDSREKESLFVEATK